jgi:hypothetical protein
MLESLLSTTDDGNHLSLDSPRSSGRVRVRHKRDAVIVRRTVPMPGDGGVKSATRRLALSSLCLPYRARCISLGCEDISTKGERETAAVSIERGQG